MEPEKFQNEVSLWKACLKHATKEWRDQYAPAVQVTDLMANHLRSVTFEAKAFPDGVWNITIRVSPRRPSEAELYFYKAMRVAGEYYLL